MNQKVIDGALELFDAVASTLGPSGKTVIIKNGDDCYVTKDGATVANNFYSTDQQKMAGVMLAKQASTSTASMAGDGTTTSAVIAGNIVSAATKLGTNPVLLKEGMEAALCFVKEKIASKSIPVLGDRNVVKAIASISANNDESVGEVIAKAIDNVGENGIVKYEIHNDTKTVVEYQTGFNIDERGYIHPCFVNNLDSCLLNDVLILVTDHKISNQSQIVEICEEANKQEKSLLIVASSVEAEALAFLEKNVTKKSLKCCAIQKPGHGFTSVEMCTDLAIAVNANYVKAGEKSISIDDLGHANQVFVSRNSTQIIGLKGDVSVRVEGLKSLIKSKSTDELALKTLNSRLANLTTGTSIIKIGGFNDAEKTELAHRIDDALRAVYAAIEEGVVLGGGISLFHVSNAINLADFKEEHHQGVLLVKNGILAPLIKNLNNSGIEDTATILSKLESDTEIGFNTKTKCFENFKETKILDPAKVSRVAVENAVKISSVLLNTNYVIVK